MQPLGVHHVSVNVSNVEAAAAFYTGPLGMTVRDDRPDFGFGGAWLAAGDQQVHLIEGSTPPNLGQHLAIEVADLDAAIAELRQQGIEVSDASLVGPGRQAFTVDPSGNGVELYQFVGNVLPKS
ncbi:MAG: VOC family protein [Acidimicrobiales bacterium]